MEEKLQLSSVTGYELRVDVDELRSQTKGYYKSQSIALIDSEGAGWWGSNGRVTSVKLYSDGTNIYKVEEIGKFVDEDREYKSEIIKKIKIKLTEEEIHFLKSNSLT